MKALHKIVSFSLVFALMFSGCSKKADSDTLKEATITITQNPEQDEITPTQQEEPNEVIENEYPALPVTKVRELEDNYRTYYEVFLYSYYDSNGDGIGDINGLISKLDYLNDNDPTTDSDLGVTGIWLMPIMPSGTYHKYDVKDYYDVDPSYGTLEDFNQLIDECHKRNIRLIIDLVFNHTSNQHPWFQEAVTYLRSLNSSQEPSVSECKYFGYYNFAKDKGDNGSYYRVDNTDWYYEGVFVSEMPDLNLSNEEVRQEIEQIAKYWLDLGVDGFRIDAAKEFFSGSQTKNVEVLSWFQTYVKSIKPEAYLVAEVWDSFGTIASYYESGIDSIFNYAFGDSTGKIALTVNSAGNQKAGYNLATNMKQVQDIFSLRNPSYIDASFLSNHDNYRVSSYVGYDEELVKLMGGINLMMNGTSFIYYGEEIGMVGTGKDENKRAPMYWSTTDLAGMTKGPMNMEKQTQVFPTVEEQQEDAGSILNYYKRAIRLRENNPEILRGDVEVIEGLDKDITAVTKTYEDSTIIILMNISSEEKQVVLRKDIFTYEDISGALTTTSIQPVLSEETITLPPHAIVILR